MSQQPSITIISGPQGCGKTRCLEVLREMYPCDGVLDSWDGSINHLMQATSFAARSTRHGPATPTSLSGYRLLVLTHLPVQSILSRKLMSRIAAEGFITTVVDFVKIQDEVFRRFNATSDEPVPCKETIVKMAHRQHQPAFVKLGDHANGTTLIMQQQLLTHIETSVDRRDAISLVQALCQHFNLSVLDIHNQ